MLAEALDCPQCGGPLHLTAQQRITICIYCTSTVRVTPPSPSDTPTTATPLPFRATAEAIPPAVLDEIKQLLMNGQLAEAQEKYQAVAQVTPAEAAEALTALTRQVLYRIIRQQGINRLGWLFVGLGLVAAVGSLATLVTGTLPLWASLLSITFSALWLAVWAGPAINSVRWMGATVSPATVLKVVPIGKKGMVTFFRAWVQVRPANAPMFHTQMNLPVRPQSLHKLHPDAEMEIRYFPNAPEQAVFERILRF